MTIFPHLLCFLHFSIVRLRLGQDLGVVSGWKQPEKGARRENKVKTMSFWPFFFFFFKGISSKTMSFWSKKKKLGLLCFLQLDVEEEKQKEEEEEGKGEERGRIEVYLRTTSRLVRGKCLARLSGVVVKGRRIAWSLGVPFTTMHTTLTQQGNCTIYQYGNLCRMRLIASQSSYQYVKVNKNGNSRRNLRVDHVGTNPKKN